MKVSQAVSFHLQYHQAISKKIDIRYSCPFTISVSIPHCLLLSILAIRQDQENFKRPEIIQWQIVDDETVDEIIFKTMTIRNRLMLELMARGGMRIEEVLNLTIRVIEESSPSIQNPQNGRVEETVYVPRQILVSLTDYTKANDITGRERIFPISYVAAWSMFR